MGKKNKKIRNKQKKDNKNEKHKGDETSSGHIDTLNGILKEDNKNERNMNDKVSSDADAKSASNVENDISHNTSASTSTHVREMKNINTGKCNNGFGKDASLDKSHSKNAPEINCVNKNSDQVDTNNKEEQNLMVHKSNVNDIKHNDFEKKGHGIQTSDCNEKTTSGERSYSEDTGDANITIRNSDQRDTDCNEEKDLQIRGSSKKEIKNSVDKRNLESDMNNHRNDNGKGKVGQDKKIAKEKTQNHNDANTCTSETKFNNQRLKNVKGGKDGNKNKERVKTNLERENSNSREISHVNVQRPVKNENECNKVNAVQSGSSKRNHSFINSNSLERPHKKGELYDSFEKKYITNKEGMDFHIVNEIDGDLFSASNDYSLGHCVAEDMGMGSGIAVTFRQTFKQVDELLNQREGQGGLAVLQDKQRYIYYLVTKKISSGKPTYYTLWCSLQKMKQHILSYSVTKLALPRIGCGLDGLEWKFVKKMLEYIFQDVDIEIKIYNFQQNPDAPSPSQLRKCHVENVSYPIKDIGRYTIIIYFGSEDGYVTDELKIICEKFPHIRNKYKSGDRQVGKHIFTETGSEEYIFYGCIVRKSHTDPFDFTYFQKCLNPIQVTNRKRKYPYEYIAFQAFMENGDELIVSKIVNLMRHSMTGVSVYVCWPENLDKNKPIY